MQSDEFWLNVAHANGVHSDSYVLLHAKANRGNIKDSLVDPASRYGDTNYTVRNYMAEFLCGYVPLFITFCVGCRLVLRAIKRRKNEEKKERWQRQVERLVPVEIIPPTETTPQQPPLQEVGLTAELKLQLQEFGQTVEQVEEHLEGRMAAFSTMVSTVPQGHPLREQVKQTCELAEETARTIVETKRLLKELNRYL
jgi:ribosomal protein S26